MAEEEFERKLRIRSDSHPRLYNYLSTFQPKALSHEILTLMELGLMVVQSGITGISKNEVLPEADGPDLTDTEAAAVPEMNVESLMGTLDLGDAIFDLMDNAPH